MTTKQLSEANLTRFTDCGGAGLLGLRLSRDGGLGRAE